MKTDSNSDRISAWFERHPGTLCELCETEKATTFLELWRPGSESVSIDWTAEHPGTAVCETCLPSLVNVPNRPWPEEDQH